MAQSISQAHIVALALGKQDYPDSLRRYLFEQLFHPAEKIRQASEARHAKP